MPVIRPEPRHAHRAAVRARCRCARARSPRPAAGARLRAAVARADARRHDRQRLRRRHRARAAGATRTSTTCSRRSTRSSAPRSARGDVAGAYAGVRPLISTGDPKKSVDISRKAELYETSSGMVTITGGKLTTWRRMAKLAVDRIVERDGRDGAVPHARDPARAWRSTPAALPRVEGVPEDGLRAARRPLRLRRARRARARRRARRARAAGPRRPPRPARRGGATPRGASRRETVGDVLLRRTRLGLTGARALCAPGEQAPERVAAALGAELGWDAARRARRGGRVPRRGGRPRASWWRGVSAPGTRAARGRPAARARRRAAADGDRQRDARLVLRRRRAARRRGARRAGARAGGGGRADRRRRRRVGVRRAPAGRRPTRRSRASCR